jgi:hypothetical protein
MTKRSTHNTLNREKNSPAERFFKEGIVEVALELDF